MRIHRANSIIEIDAIGDAWRDRDAAVPCPQLQFAWTRACLTAFAGDAAPHVVAGFVADELVAVAPLVQQPIHGINRITLAGARELPGPIALAHGEARTIERLLRRLAHQATPLVLERLAADSWACASCGVFIGAVPSYTAAPPETRRTSRSINAASRPNRVWALPSVPPCELRGPVPSKLDK